MSSQVFAPLVNVEELIGEILMYRQITCTEQLLLRYALLCDHSMSETERTLIDRVFYGVRHGLLRIVD
ncbi:MAG: hypothetical protein U7123_05850 [Potamolinea sp.]